MSLVALSTLILLILILVVAATVGIASRRSRAGTPDHHHWVVRVLCAGLLAGSLAAVAVGTWRGTGGKSDAPEVIVSMPTQAPPPLPGGTERYGKVELGPTKLVGTVLLASKQQDRFLPLCGETRTLDWPLKSGGVPIRSYQLRFTGALGDSSYDVTMDLGDFINWQTDGRIRTGGVSMQTRGSHWSRGRGSDLILDTLHVSDFGGHGDDLRHAPLSLVPTVGGRNLCLLVHLTRAAPDDPLRQLSASEWLNADPQTLRRDTSNLHAIGEVRSDPSMPPGIRMIAFLGPAAVLLLLAAIAGSALFARGRRAYAFTGLLACMVLYAGGLDAIILQRRALLASDPKQSETIRMQSVHGMARGTFFHTGRAVAMIRQIAEDSANPAFIRSQAEALANQADHR